MRAKQRRAWLVLLAVMVAAPAIGGCASWPDERRATFGIEFPPPAADEQPTAILFMIDGVNAEIFRTMLDEGRLPNIRKYVVDRGLYIERAVCSVPGVTLPNETSLVTGVLPGRHNVTGISWFDRNRLIYREYDTVAQKNTLDGDYTAPTIFERFPDATTMSVFFQAHRGASKFIEDAMMGGAPFAFGWYGMVDRLTLAQFDMVAEVATVQGAFPKVVFGYLLSTDMQAYAHGVSSKEYQGALEHTDAHLGRLFRDLEAAGRLDKTILALVSDHGMVDVKHHWCVAGMMRDVWNVDVAPDRLWESTPFEHRLAAYDKHACVLAGSGQRYCALYLRRPRAGAATGGNAAFENWLARPPPDDLRHYPTRDGKRLDLIDLLMGADAVDVLAYRAAPNVVHVMTKKGLVEITRSGPDGRRFALRALKGENPLGYRETVPAGLLDGAPHGEREWLEGTAQSSYPDLVPQIVVYFDAPRAGDIAIFAAPNWDFCEGKRGGHGSLRAEDMYTFMALAGPGVPHERRRGPERTVSFSPTILDLLGRPIPPGLDGRSVIRK
jgi:arylsulfatase A-like enzyme